ncbi:MAG: rod shape-determining protein MreC [Candidatus Hydrogenedentes bacterium]|nr:rod shape-determining protein MreC [Candidatus Hydrogenedentota bacterium]
MSLSRRISEQRPTVILAILVLLSLMSLASGQRGNLVTRGIKTTVSVVAYPFWQAMNHIENSFSYVTGFVTAYSSARSEAFHLREEIGALTPRIADRDALEAENQRLRRMLEFEQSQPRLSLKPAEVVSVSAEIISNRAGVLIINRGSIHGVKEAMCAMTPDGVVGIVTEVEPALSYVATLHSDFCKIGAIIGRDRRVWATVHGSGKDFGPLCKLEYIDAKDVVRIGDEVLTRGSGIFPSEYRIGKIVDLQKGGSLFQVAYVEPYANPYAIDELFLVARAQPRLAEMVGQAPPDTIEHMAFAMPDERSIQERFAP